MHVSKIIRRLLFAEERMTQEAFIWKWQSLLISWCRFSWSNGHPSSAPWSLCCHCFEDEAFKTTTTGVTPTRWPVLATFSNGRSKINNNENTAYEWKHIFALFVVDRSYHRHRNNIKWPGVCGVLQEACFPKNPCQQVRTLLSKGYNESISLKSSYNEDWKSFSS